MIAPSETQQIKQRLTDLEGQVDTLRREMLKLAKAMLSVSDDVESITAIIKRWDAERGE